MDKDPHLLSKLTHTGVDSPPIRTPPQLSHWMRHFRPTQQSVLLQYCWQTEMHRSIENNKLPCFILTSCNSFSDRNKNNRYFSRQENYNILSQTRPSLSYREPLHGPSGQEIALGSGSVPPPYGLKTRKTDSKNSAVHHC